MSQQTSSSFALLDPRIQRFLWAQGWESLRDAQERAIAPILEANRDVIVAAATAAGKTEAAFLPALTRLCSEDTDKGPRELIVYISPLKALINDQFGRLDQLCEQLEVPVWPWHGDVPASKKTKFFKAPAGVLLITPESVEAMLCNRGSSVKKLFERLAYVVIDELHAFIGSERGKQLQSLMHRIESVIERRVPRIGLSATLGDMSLAAEFLRPGCGPDVCLIESTAQGSELQVLVKGYEEPVVTRQSMRPKTLESEQQDSGAASELGEEDVEPITPAQVGAHLFKCLRGSNNLVFPNSRREVERYTHILTRMCDEALVPNEFWPHHGSLSKEIRADTEAALKQKVVPATAICTNTLELGIDIGAVKSVAQIGPAHSVASLRQRLGRSGRRKGEPAILRGYCIESAIDQRSSLQTLLRLDTVKMAAMITLLVQGWFEPPRTGGAHLSTLVQQMLSFIAQNGGATIGQLYKLLCAPGCPFAGVTRDEFIVLVRELGKHELLMQDSSGLLLHGVLGEQFVNHYSFYSAFQSDEEFRLVSGTKTLGTLPVSQVLSIGQRILFAGKTWLVDSIDDRQKVIYVSRAKGGAPPMFSGGPGRTHTKIRQRMRELLESSELPPYMDAQAKLFLSQGRENYRAMQLGSTIWLDQGQHALLMTWRGDACNEALAFMLSQRGINATSADIAVEVERSTAGFDEVMDALEDVTQGPPPQLDELLGEAHNLQREKWDWALPPSLLQKTYASLNLDIEQAIACAAQLLGLRGAK